MLFSEDLKMEYKKRLPGQLKKQPIDEEETYLRQNFTESDNRNFRDGDVESTLNYFDKSLDNLDI